MSKILLNNIKVIPICVYNSIQIVLHVKPVQKHILPAETVSSAKFFKNPTTDIHSQDPYLLGFDSNLIPNSNILVFPAVSWRGFRIFGKIGKIRM